MHSDKCKEFIQANSPGFSLATEYIELLDPDRDEKVWQRFQNPEDILPDLQAWLSGDEPSPHPGPAKIAPAANILPPGIKPARLLAAASPTDVCHAKADAALQRSRGWLSDSATQAHIRTLAPADAAELALQRFHRELIEPQT